MAFDCVPLQKIFPKGTSIQLSLILCSSNASNPLRSCIRTETVLSIVSGSYQIKQDRQSVGWHKISQNGRVIHIFVIEKHLKMVKTHSFQTKMADKFVNQSKKIKSFLNINQLQTINYQSQQIMKTVLAFICILVLSQAAQLSSLNSYPVSKPTNLGFGNYTGSGVDPSIIPNIVNLINGASGFYKNDVAANIKYLKTNLDYMYPNAPYSFVIYIQTQAYVCNSWYLYSSKNFLIGLQNVNVINPGWSYQIVLLYGPTDLSGYTYLKIPNIGYGITQDIRVFISNTISLYEPDQLSCSCQTYSIINIGDALIKQYGKPWNTICDALGVTEGIVNAAFGLWGTFRAKKCFYTLYVNAVGSIGQ